MNENATPKNDDRRKQLAIDIVKLETQRRERRDTTARTRQHDERLPPPSEE